MEIEKDPKSYKTYHSSRNLSTERNTRTVEIRQVVQAAELIILFLFSLGQAEELQILVSIEFKI